MPSSCLPSHALPCVIHVRLPSSIVRAQPFLSCCMSITLCYVESSVSFGPVTNWLLPQICKLHRMRKSSKRISATDVRSRGRQLGFATTHHFVALRDCWSQRYLHQLPYGARECRCHCCPLCCLPCVQYAQVASRASVGAVAVHGLDHSTEGSRLLPCVQFECHCANGAPLVPYSWSIAKAGKSTWT